MSAVPACEPDVNVLSLEADEVQIQVGSIVWHRACADHLHTACGLTIDFRLQLGQRLIRYEGQLCEDGCFSAFELDLAARNNAAAHQDIDRGPFNGSGRK